VVGDGKRLRISVRLIDTKRDDHVWSRRFTGDMEQVFDIQERIARAVVAALQVHLAPEEDQRLAEPGVTDVRAWQRVVLARQATLRWRPDALDEARRLLEEALALTGDNVVICAALGRVVLNYREAGVRSDEDTLREAADWAERARAVDPDHPETRVLGAWLAFADGDLATAITDLHQALESDRDHPDALLLLANCLLLGGQVDRARPVIDHAVAVDPLTPVSRCMPGYADAYEGRFEAAVGPYRAMLDADPGNPVARLFNVWILLAAGRNDEALAMAGSFDKATEGTVAAHIARRFAEAHLGTAEPLPQPIREGAAGGEMYARLTAEAWALAGNGERAAHWLRTAMGLGFANWPYVHQHSPFFRGVAGHPDFVAAVRELETRWRALDVALARAEGAAQR
jgi:tetratricopeptide (TPR) repeat protein